MRFFMTLSLVVLLSGFGNSSTIKVPGDYLTIQEAIDAAVTGDTVLVALGTYNERIDFKGKAISVIGDSSSGKPTIDGHKKGSVVTCQSGEDNDTVLEGFIITNGLSQKGSGMLIVSSGPTISQCTFYNNGKGLGEVGGGMYNLYSNPILTDCEFMGNRVTGFGGGMCNYSSDPTMTRCVFEKNEAQLSGGGLYSQSCHLTLNECEIIDNQGSSGGGLFNTHCDLIIVNSIVRDNTANQPYAGGLFNFQSSSSLVANCLFIRNDEYGMRCHGNEIITNCIFWAIK